MALCPLLFAAALDQPGQRPHPVPHISLSIRPAEDRPYTYIYPKPLATISSTRCIFSQQIIFVPSGCRKDTPSREPSGLAPLVVI